MSFPGALRPIPFWAFPNNRYFQGKHELSRSAFGGLGARRGTWGSRGQGYGPSSRFPGRAQGGGRAAGLRAGAERD